MATFTDDFSGRPACILYLVVNEGSRNIVANTSVVSWSLYVVGNNASWGLDFSSTYSVSINGVPYSGNWNYDFRSNNTRVLDGNSLTVAHNANGSKTISASATATDNAGSLGSASTSGSLVLIDFDFTAGVPTSFTAVNVPGTGIVANWVASVSYKTPVTYYLSYRSSSDGGSTWGSWSAESSTTNLTYTYGGLTPGLTYQLRIRAYNGFDNYSAYAANQPTVFLTSGGKRWNGTNWALTSAEAKRWNGSAWITLTTTKRFDGTNWVNLS
jgi:hypothetical protein